LDIYREYNFENFYIISLFKLQFTIDPFAMISKENMEAKGDQLSKTMNPTKARII